MSWGRLDIEFKKLRVTNKDKRWWGQDQGILNRNLRGVHIYCIFEVELRDFKIDSIKKSKKGRQSNLMTAIAVVAVVRVVHLLITYCVQCIMGMSVWSLCHFLSVFSLNSERLALIKHCPVWGAVTQAVLLHGELHNSEGKEAGDVSWVEVCRGSHNAFMSSRTGELLKSSETWARCH